MIFYLKGLSHQSEGGLQVVWLNRPDFWEVTHWGFYIFVTSSGIFPVYQSLAATAGKPFQNGS